MSRFTPELRERFLGLYESGRTVDDCAAAVGITSRTVRDWLTRGRAQAGTEAGAFAAEFDAIRDGDTGRLCVDDVVQMLERAARRGSVVAMKALLLELRDLEPDLDDALSDLQRRVAAKRAAFPPAPQISGEGKGDGRGSTPGGARGSPGHPRPSGSTPNGNGNGE